MKIKEHEVLIKDLIDGYIDNQEDGTYELLDGQQRTLSICRYWDNQYSLNFDGTPKQFHNLTPEEQDQILNYGIKVYFCVGTVAERKKWFEIINFKGEALTRQELLNAIYSGPWVTDAKRYFSKTGCAAYQIANDYMSNKSAIRQEILETALKWIADRENLDYEEYMAIHQHDADAEELWLYFKSVIDWTKKIFGCPDHYRSDMKKVDWGFLYNKYSDNIYDTDTMEQKVSALMSDYEVTKRPGIHQYVFDGDERHLNLRTFDERTKKTVYEQRGKKCFICGREKPYKEMHGNHWIPWSKGGTTVIDNCKMLCVECNLKKSAKEI